MDQQSNSLTTNTPKPQQPSKPEPYQFIPPMHIQFSKSPSTKQLIPQCLINAVMLIIFGGLFLHFTAMAETNMKLNEMIIAIAQGIAEKSSSYRDENHIPKQLTTKNLEETVGLEAFIQIVAQGFRPQNVQRLLGRGRSAMKVNGVIATLLSISDSSDLLIQLQRKHFETTYKLPTVPLDKELTRHNFCILINAKYDFQPYLNEKPYKLAVKTVDSILKQNYTNFKVVYIDQSAMREESDMVWAHVAEKHEEDADKFFVEREQLSKSKIVRIRNSVEKHCSKQDIGLLINVGDQVIGPNVLELLDEVYRQGAWVTSSIPIEGQTLNVGDYDWYEHWRTQSIESRKQPVENLKTFRVELFLKFSLADFGVPTEKQGNNPINSQKKANQLEEKIHPDEFDDSFMYPMIEASGEHYHFIPQILYKENSGQQIPRTQQQDQDYQQYRQQIQNGRRWYNTHTLP